MVEDVEALLRAAIQADRLPLLHVVKGDKITGRLWGDIFSGRPHAVVPSLPGRKALC